MIVPNERFWKVFKETPGALSCAEAIAIMNVASLAPDGISMELGSYKGKSSMATVCGMNYDRIFILVDPEFKDVFWYEKVEKVLNEVELNTNSYVMEADYSTNIIGEYDGYAWVFVDSGSHGDGLPMQEVKMLEDKMRVGGILCFHDYKNQFVEVEQAYNYLLSTGKYEEIQINWPEIFNYVKEHDLEANNNSWHQYPDLPHPPNFVGALKRIK